VGDVYGSMDFAAAAEVRVSDRGDGGDDRELRLRADGAGTDAGAAGGVIGVDEALATGPVPDPQGDPRLLPPLLRGSLGGAPLESPGAGHAEEDLGEDDALVAYRGLAQIESKRREVRLRDPGHATLITGLFSVG